MRIAVSKLSGTHLFKQTWQISRNSRESTKTWATMLESLLVLTILNCFFMFSSTVTTCALWWQYRSHRCCVRKHSPQQAPKSHLRKSKSSCTCHTKLSKAEKSKLNGFIDALHSDKTDTKEESEKSKSKTRKSKTKLKYLSQYKRQLQEKAPPAATPKAKDLEEKSQMSEASQTTNDAKSTVVMEFSTVQKVVQRVDNDSDITIPKLALKSLAESKKDTLCNDPPEKKIDFDAEKKFESNLMTVDQPV